MNNKSFKNNQPNKNTKGGAKGASSNHQNPPRGRNNNRSSSKSSQQRSQTKKRQNSNHSRTSSRTNNSWKSSFSRWSKKSQQPKYTKANNDHLPLECKYWNQSCCTKQEQCEFSHIHMTRFHKTADPNYQKAALIINQQYEQQIKNNNILVEVKMLKFIPLTELYALMQQNQPNVINQAISIGILNKNAYKDYQKEFNGMKQKLPDLNQYVQQKAVTFQKHLDQIIKNNIKDQKARQLNQKNQSKKHNQQNRSTQLNNNTSQPKDMIDENGFEITIHKQDKPTNNTHQQLKKENNQINKNKYASIVDQQSKVNKQPNDQLSNNLMEVEEKKDNKGKAQQKKAEYKNITTNVTYTQPYNRQENYERDLNGAITEQKINQEVARLLENYGNRCDPSKMVQLIDLFIEEVESITGENQRMIHSNGKLNTAYKDKLVQIVTDQPTYIESILNTIKGQGQIPRQLIKETVAAIYFNAQFLFLMHQIMQKLSQEEIQNLLYEITQYIVIEINSMLQENKILEADEEINSDQLLKFLYKSFNFTGKKDVIPTEIVQVTNSSKKIALNLTLENPNKYKKSSETVKNVLTK